MKFDDPPRSDDRSPETPKMLPRTGSTRTCVIFGQILGATFLLIACVLLYSVLFSEKLPSTIKNAFNSLTVDFQVLTWRDLDSLKKDIREYQRNADLISILKQIKAAGENAINPGPPPPWYHPYDRLVVWREKKDLYDYLKKQAADAQPKLDNAHKTMSELVENTHGLVSHPDKIIKAEAILNRLTPVRLFWNQWIRPGLHLALFLALICFAIKIILRTLVISERIPPTRV